MTPRPSGRRRLALACGTSLVALSLGAVGAGSAAWSPPAGQGPVWPAAPDPARVRFVTAISGPHDVGAGRSWLARALAVVVGGRRQPRFLHPRGLATDAAGRLLIADPDQRMVHVVDVGARKYSYLEPAPFVSPVGVAVGVDQDIYVADSAKRRIYRYGPDGKRKTVLGVVNGEAIFSRPTGIAVAPDGRLFVVDTLACQITVLSPGGRVLQVFGRRGAAAGEFNYPTDITVARDGRLYVVDSMNARLQVFAADGTYLHEFGKRGNGTGDFDKPKGVAVDSDGHIYIAEAMHDVVQIFGQDGALLLVVGQSGTAAGEFSLPSALHIDSSNRIFVADTLNGRVQVFQYVSRPDAH